MRTIDCITQEAIVKTMDNGFVCVSVIRKSACGSCQSKNSCFSFETSQKEYTFQYTNSNLKPGDKVLLKMKKKLGPLAILLSYILPFIIFITFLILLKHWFNNDLVVGIGSLISLITYFSVLRLFSKKLQSTFTFDVERM